MLDHAATHFFLYQDCVLRIPSDALVPKCGSILDRIIHQAPDYLKPQGRPVFTLFGFLGVRRAEEKLRAAGLHPRILAHEEQAFPRIARERLEHIRALDGEGALPPGPPKTCSRLVLCGQKG